MIRDPRFNPRVGDVLTKAYKQGTFRRVVVAVLEPGRSGAHGWRVQFTVGTRGMISTLPVSAWRASVEGWDVEKTADARRAG